MKMSVFKCEVCSDGFYNQQSLRQHISNAHTQKVDEIVAAVGNKKLSFSYRCSRCDKCFALKSTLKRHEMKIHGEMGLPFRKCMLCPFQTPHKISWLNHLQSAHGIQVKSVYLQLSTEEEFLKWKEEVERTTHSKFIKTCGNKIVGDSIVRHYLCNRSGNYRSKSKGIRRRKLRGSIKIDGTCPAAIRVICKEGTYHIRFVSTHLCHEILDQISVNNCEAQESSSEEKQVGLNDNCETQESFSEKKQMIVSVFSDLIDGVTGNEIELANRMVTSLKENLSALRAHSSNFSSSSDRSHKGVVLAPQSMLFCRSTRKLKSPRHRPINVTDAEENNDILRILQDEEPKNIGGVTVRKDSVTLELQELLHGTPEPVSVAPKQGNATSSLQELEHSTPGHLFPAFYYHLDFC